MEDGEIVMLYLARKEQAIEKTKEKYGKRLREIALRIVGDAQTAAECENDVYLSVWRTVPPQDAQLSVCLSGADYAAYCAEPLPRGACTEPLRTYSDAERRA